MSIYANSRYIASTVVTLPDQDGNDVQAIVPSSPQTYTFNYVYYIVTSADQFRIDQLAYYYYGDATLWWKIGDANPEIMQWDSVTPGTMIRVPNA